MKIITKILFTVVSIPVIPMAFLLLVLFYLFGAVWECISDGFYQSRKFATHILNILRA